MDQLTTCGAPARPPGQCLLDPRFYRVAISLAVGETRLDIEQVVERNYILRGLMTSSTSATVLVRVRTPGNYYLSNARMPLRMIGQRGYKARANEPEIWIPAGQAVVIEAENIGAEAAEVFLVLAGVDSETLGK